MNAMWGKKFRLRGNTATATILNKAHRVEAEIAQRYAALSTWRRMVLMEPAIKIIPTVIAPMIGLRQLNMACVPLKLSVD